MEFSPNGNILIVPGVIRSEENEKIAGSIIFS